MWEAVVSYISIAVQSCFDWFSSIMDKLPGAWTSILTIFTILVISRYLLGPVLGAMFTGSSDQAKIKATAKRYRLEAAAKRYNGERNKK